MNRLLELLILVSRLVLKQSDFQKKCTDNSGPTTNIPTIFKSQRYIIVKSSPRIKGHSISPNTRSVSLKAQSLRDAIHKGLCQMTAIPQWQGCLDACIDVGRQPNRYSVISDWR